MKTEMAIALTATAISALALLGVAISVREQVRQTRITQMQSVKSHQLELFRVAYEYPELQAGWSRTVDRPKEEWRLRTYVNLVFGYLQMGYAIGHIPDGDVKRLLANRFRTRLGRDYWASSGYAFRDSATTRRAKRFYRFAEKEYRDALSVPPVDDDPAPPASRDLSAQA
jgi:hypothetical protein